MKTYTKPIIEMVELSIKENIADLPSIPDGLGGVTNADTGSEVTTTYNLGTYSGEALYSI